LTIIYGATLGFLLKTKINFQKKIIYGAIASFLLASIFIGQSRAAIISAMLITIIAAINLKKNKLNLIVLFLIIASISIKINLGNDLNVIEKIKKTNTSEYTLSHRKEIWNTGFEVFRSNVLFGIGNGNWKQITPDVIKSSVESRGSKYKEEKYFFAAHAHSLYISNLVERGLLGIFALISIIVIWAKTLIDSYRRNMLTTKGNFLWLGSLSAFISTFLIGFVNSTFHHENALIALFFFSLHVIYNKKINAK
jgi:O-antigen ligase